MPTDSNLLTLPGTIRIVGRKLSSFTVMELSDRNTVTLFIAVESALKEFGLIVAPIGKIRNTLVCSIQEMFDAAEASAEHQYLYDAMVSTLSMESGTITINDRTFSTVILNDSMVCLDANKYVLPFVRASKSRLMQIMKCLCFTLDESVLISVANARLIMGKRKQQCNRANANKGFSK